MILDELIAYVGLDHDDSARLVALHDRLAPAFPQIAARFYEAVWASPGAASVLSGPAQVERLRVTLIDWMSTGLRGPYDLDFNEKRARIGRVHVQIGLSQQYMFTSVNVVRTAYSEHIARLYPADEALAVMRSVDKLFDIELALMLRHYQLVSEERLVQRERSIQSDRFSALQTMSSGLAHEVRNPLNAAKLQLELLERRLRRQGDDPKMTEPVHLAHVEIERLTALLNEFLAFSRPSELHLAPHDVVVIVRQVLELERPLAERAGVELVLASTPEVATATIDSRKLHQVVQNLVRNAIEASGAGGHVAIEIELVAGMVHIRVKDTGPGIPEAIRSRIYEPFFSTKEGGTGMGMSIVHNFVSLHGGTIDLASTGQGATIDVAIPRR